MKGPKQYIFHQKILHNICLRKVYENIACLVRKRDQSNLQVKKSPMQSTYSRLKSFVLFRFQGMHDESF